MNMSQYKHLGDINTISGILQQKSYLKPSREFNRSLLSRDSYPHVYYILRYIYSNNVPLISSWERSYVYFLILVEHRSVVRSVSMPSFIRRLSWPRICNSRASIGTNCRHVIGGWWSMNFHRWISLRFREVGKSVPALILSPGSRFIVRPR